MSASHAGSMIDKGREMLGSLMGGEGFSSLGAVLGKFKGMGSGSMLGMLGGLAPLLLGGLKRIKSTMGLDAGGLAGLLGSQKQNIAAAMPQGLGSILGAVPGLGGLASGAREAAASARGFASDAADRVREPVAGVGNALKWLIPVAALVLLGIFLVAKYAGRDNGGAPAGTPTPQAGTPSRADDARTAGATLGPAVDAATNQVKQVLSTSTDALTGITDAASAEATLPKLRELSATVDGLATTVGALPTEARKPVARVLGAGVAQLQELASKAMAIPGVGEKIRPVVEPMLSKLQALSAG